MKHYIFNLALFFVLTTVFSQEDVAVNVNIQSNQKYIFTPLVEISSSNVKDQGITGTCWSFSTSSFLESEIERTLGEKIDISEMFTVRNTYITKSWNYIMRQGKTQFSEGGLAHDVLNSVKKYGLMPESAYSGLLEKDSIHNHEKLAKDLQTYLDNYIKADNKADLPYWKISVDSILDVHLGKVPEFFFFEDQMYSPLTFLERTKLQPERYVSLTSFLHEPFFTHFVLNIPDNFSNGSFYNLPLNSLEETVDFALKKGYSVALDCDVSEKTFSQKNGIAIFPFDNVNNEKSLTNIVIEKEITPNFREQEFENYNTTDDHLMHIVGIVTDQNGTQYYKVKNSWGTGEKIGNNGFIYMSKAYFKLKTISVTLPSEAIPSQIKNMLKL